jgi:acyl carrier protein
MPTIMERVQTLIIDKLNVEKGQVTPEARFATDLGADSLDVVELLMDFEKEFTIAIPDEDAEGIETVAQAVEYIEKAVSHTQ